MDANGKAVVVTTQHRGVFFGYVVHDDKLPAEITLRDARNCLYWSASLHGFVGLATTGPNSKCRIGPSVSQIQLFDVTSILDCTPDSVVAWEASPWK
jgi:hypothetical protein